MAHLEHANITVRDAEAAAATLCDLFGWRIRWSGDAIGGGRSVHVGDDEAYLALYTPAGEVADGPSSYGLQRCLNHVGIVVDDLDASEALVRDAGFVPRSHADYEPGRRFYFDGPDGLEIEVVAYDNASAS
ncbi:VOC family protein [Jannaschia aquimarina]|uniref:Glyoxalase-like domain protein n=1 Tax=Jannaschia aquimarina TaxID=935700 RepID=A0A0D1EAT8_9RHOB|nr:VOC family protein [Jannaschia aquimarina]KIT14819.1 Glyoxalase-like domain protein [Jannaschia aquimarina]SNS56849.1 Catechol 2,3-dioxygenase [Jannaschia aquimarina]